MLPKHFTRNMAIIGGATTTVVTLANLAKLISNLKVDRKRNKIGLKDKNKLISVNELFLKKIIPQTLFVFLQLLTINIIMNKLSISQKYRKSAFFIGSAIAFVFTRLFKFRIPLSISLYVSGRIGVC